MSMQHNPEAEKLIPLIEEWRKAKRCCQDLKRRMDAGEEIDFEEYMAALDERRDAANMLAFAFERQIDTGYVAVPDTQAILEVLDEARGPWVAPC